MANIRHTDHTEWEVDPSTRQSVHAYTKYTPFAISTSTTAVDLLSVSKGEIATNLVTNPRIEDSDVTMYTATGSTVARDTGQQALGAASLLVDPANAAAGEGFYWVTPSLPFSVHTQYISAQIEHRGASASGNVKLEIRNAAGTTVLATSGSDDLAASWRRITVAYGVAGSTASTSYRVYVTTNTQHNINFYVDKIMFEVREDTAAVSTYLDGASGINYAWDNTAHASASKKRPAMTVIRGLKLVNDTGSVAVHVAFDTTATVTSGIKVNGGETFETNWPIDFRKNVSVVAASGTPAIHGVIWGITTG